jgi:hypothetical protein
MREPIRWLLNLRDSIVRGNFRGAVKEIKDRMKSWCNLVEVDKLPSSKFCCHSHSEIVKVKKYNDKVVKSVLHCSKNKCRNPIDRDMNRAANIYMLLAKMIQTAVSLSFLLDDTIHFDHSFKSIHHSTDEDAVSECCF